MQAYGGSDVGGHARRDEGGGDNAQDEHEKIDIGALDPEHGGGRQEYGDREEKLARRLWVQREGGRDNEGYDDDGHAGNKMCVSREAEPAQVEPRMSVDM